VIAGPRRISDLPSCSEVRTDAYRRLGNVEDVLRSDWRPGGEPTARQARAMRKAAKAIAEAKAWLTEAVYR
jgi:hypothetical protein